MKISMRLCLAVFTLTLFCSCSRSYVISLTNGSRVVCAGKPQLKNGYYTFKDAAGEKYTVSEFRVREIAPASMSQPEFKTDGNSGFLPK